MLTAGELFIEAGPNFRMADPGLHGHYCHFFQTAVMKTHTSGGDLVPDAGRRIRIDEGVVSGPLNVAQAGEECYSDVLQSCLPAQESSR